MNFKSPNNSNLTKILGQNTIKYKRISHSIHLVESLQRLFSNMSLSNKRASDPSLILVHLVDEFGNRISLGD